MSTCFMDQFVSSSKDSLKDVLLLAPFYRYANRGFKREKIVEPEIKALLSDSSPQALTFLVGAGLTK